MRASWALLSSRYPTSSRLIATFSTGETLLAACTRTILFQESAHFPVVLLCTRTVPAAGYNQRKSDQWKSGRLAKEERKKVSCGFRISTACAHGTQPSLLIVFQLSQFRALTTPPIHLIRRLVTWRLMSALQTEHNQTENKRGYD